MVALLRSENSRLGKKTPRLWLWLTLAILLAGCQSTRESPQAGSEEEPGVASLPAATAPPFPTQNPKSKIQNPETETKRTVGGIAYSFRYDPSFWSADLTHCTLPNPKSEIQNPKFSGAIPAGCATTDFLVGQKALDVGQISGDTFVTLNGKRAIRRVEADPPSGMASRVYTLVVYEDAGAPIFGFVTYIGPGTGTEEQEQIIASLDGVSRTLSVERQP